MNLLPDNEMEQFQIGGAVIPNLQDPVIPTVAESLKNVPSAATKVDFKNAVTSKASDLQNKFGDMTQKLQSNPNFLSLMESKDKLGGMFYIFISNLIEKGSSTLIHLLGWGLDVNVDTEDPGALIDRFKDKLSDPKMQEKLLQLIQGLIVTTEPALKAASAEIIALMGDTIERMSQQGIKIGWDIAGTIPVAGELIEGVKAMLDVFKAGVVGVEAAAKTSTLASETLKDVEEKIEEKAPMSLKNSGLRGGKNVEKQYKSLKKIQLNTMNRVSNAFQEFYGTRKRRRGTKTRVPKINNNKTRSRRYTRKSNG